MILAGRMAPGRSPVKEEIAVWVQVGPARRAAIPSTSFGFSRVFVAFTPQIEYGLSLAAMLLWVSHRKLSPSRFFNCPSTQNLFRLSFARPPANPHEAVF